MNGAMSKGKADGQALFTNRAVVCIEKANDYQANLMMKPCGYKTNDGLLHLIKQHWLKIQFNEGEQQNSFLIQSLDNQIRDHHAVSAYSN